jgi:anthranilate 1,2-dioxygenase small subunit
MTCAPHPISRDIELAVTRLYEDYAAVIDDGLLDRWPEFFTEDCNYQVISRENVDAGLTHATIYCDGLGMVRDRANATRDCTVYEPRYLRHFLGSIRVSSVDGEVIRSTGSFLVVESVSDSEPYVHTVGQYRDRIVSGPDGLKFQERLCVYDNYRIFNSLVFPV